MIGRRRFLAISAAFVGCRAQAAAPLRWAGHALGAEVSLELHGPAPLARRALQRALRQIRRVEGLFSLYDPTSLLSQLNRDRILKNPPPDFLRLLDEASRIHHLTDGLFDPTVQALWQAHAHGTSVATARRLIGWHRVRVGADDIHLEKDQSLTFNGIAQGYATDLVTETLTAEGLQDVHVNIGEQAARGRARRLGIVDPMYGMIGTITLEGGAIATSSPAATMLGATGHILSPLRGRKPQWSTVSVVATTATLADGLSTALCLADNGMIAALRQRPEIRRILTVDAAGDVVSF